MKLKLRILNVSAGLCLLAFSARADEAGTAAMPDDATNQMQGVRGMLRSYQLNGAAKASDVTGLKVYNYQNEELGKVYDLLLDVEAGRVVQVIISSGGFMGIDSTLLAVPPAMFNQELTNRMLLLDVTKDKFLAGPKFTGTNEDETIQSNAVCEVYDYYGQRPFFGGARYGTNTVFEPGWGPLSLNMDGTPNVTSGTAMDMAHSRKIVEAYSQNTDGTLNGTNSSENWSSGREMHRAQLGYLQTAGKLTGLPVKNARGEKVGAVNDFAVDLRAGRIVAVIVASGGFLGMDNELSAAPPMAFQFAGQHDALVFDTSKEALARAPHFHADQWPDMGQPAYAGSMYHAYHAEPYFDTNGASANGMTGADNTGRNFRDRSGRTLTPLDQGNSQADINTTVQVRKEILANQSLSIDAKNVKVITVDGKVTLRGPVNSNEEKNTIGDIATHIAQGETVDNQLEVRSMSGN